MKLSRTIGLVLAFAIAFLAVPGALGQRKTPNVRDGNRRITLANGWRLTPAGRHVELPGDLPGSMALTPDGRYLFVNTCGYHGHSLSVIDTEALRIVQKFNLVRDWVGMSFDPSTGTLAISGAGNSEYKPKRNGSNVDGASELPPSAVGALFRFHWNGRTLAAKDGLALSGINDDDRYVSGILSLGHDEAIVLNSQTDTLLRMNLASGRVFARAKVGYRPYAAAISPDRTTAAVSNWGAGTVTLLDARSLKSRTTVSVGAQPGALVYSKDGRLFVANSGVNTVSVLRGGKVVETIRTSISSGPATGTTPAALAISKNGARLYVADAGNNCVAVVDTSRRESRVIGFIPTGRYPSALVLSPNGRRLYIGTAKGLSFRANADVRTDSTQDVYRNYLGYSGNKENRGIRFDYVGGILSGHVSAVDLPDAKGLAKLTSQVRHNSPAGLAATVSPAQRKAIQSGALSKIKHVVYIIKENRTYDQVLGDDRRGNGDPNLTIFGEKVTPNEHKIVRQFVLLDNLYCDGEVSQVGHQWTDSAYATDFTEKAWVMSYSDRGQLDADTRLSSSPAGFIWNDFARHDKRYRIYGEYMQYSGEHDDAPDMILHHAERYHFSQEFENVHKAKGRDPRKAQVFIKEMRDAERTGKWPALMVVALPEDHTRGLKAGAYSPLSMVASNDKAVGMIVEAISRSKLWKDTAIFIIQDDAQNGPDHVDAHRSVGMVISPYVRRGFVDHTMYSTSSMLRTMELMFGLPPMTQYDAAATPMYRLFTTHPDFAPYRLEAPRVDLNVKNPKGTSLAKRSALLDFSDDDRADPDEFNAILWAALKPGVPMPPPVHGLRPGP